MSAGEEESGPLAKLREIADRNEGTSRLADAVEDYLSAKARSLVSGASGKLGQTVERFMGGGDGGGALAKGAEKMAQGEGPLKSTLAAAGQGVKDKTKGAVETLTGGGGDDEGGSGGGGGGGGNKATNIVEDIDVGVPVRVAYNQWSRFSDFSEFTHRVESVEEEDEVNSRWSAKIFWSSRSWKGIVTEQVQDQRIAWTSEGAKGTTKGVVTFHPLGENLTKILLVTEYTPRGFFERTANLWRAQGRRLRLELKQYRRHLMMLAEAQAQEIEGWRGEIRDSEVVVSHEDALAEEEEQASSEEQDHSEDEFYDDEPQGDEALEEEEPEDEDFEDEEPYDEDEDFEEEGPDDEDFEDEPEEDEAR
ncbi:SRPBCC family protein [Nocardiopsis alkaliphila]|mgnify:CR=1 FL=1|uniref:SRPBCC family protein n=1 Tax=Nocardiopsis alkaliphila TaxID=225762 RepID=UPI0003472ECD|nr:SRPBCC family protein [Nocardiopsis alkaliphila]